MARIVTDYLDETAKNFPEKAAFIDEKRSMTFRELQSEAHHIAAQIIGLGIFKSPVIIFLEKSAECIAAFMGAVYSGNFYSPLDTKMPPERIKKIVEKLQPAAVITNEQHKSQVQEFISGVPIILYEEAQKFPADIEAINSAKKKILDSDVLYVLFTSGSTGTPKGAIISHRGIIDLSEWATKELKFDSNMVMANQTPFYFSYSVYDVFQTLKHGATTYIIPEILFSQPTKLMRFLDEKKINTLVWVPSLLQFLSSFNSLNRPHLQSLKNIYFSGEVFQTKHLNRWRKEYPDVKIVNIFGPTEVTDTCIFYEIVKDFKDDEMLPIGKSCENKECFLLDNEDRLITTIGELGEICVRGSGLGYGYYNDPERTSEVFVQNPLNKAYPEIIYRTGDLARYNEDGEMVYVCRKDFQIKHLGMRIELGEIEAAASSLEGVEDCCCLYDEEKLKITLFYTGNNENISGELKEKLPSYMIPEKYFHLQEMPHNLNGKIDRQKLKELMKEKY